jgi:hypothetical protein
LDADDFTVKSRGMTVEGIWYNLRTTEWKTVDKGEIAQAVYFWVQEGKVTARGNKVARRYFK